MEDTRTFKDRWEQGKEKEEQFVKDFCSPYGLKHLFVDDELRDVCDEDGLTLSKAILADIGTVFGDIAVEFNGVLILVDVKQNWIAKKSIDGFKNNLTYYAMYFPQEGRTMLLRRDVVAAHPNLVYREMPSGKQGLSPEFILREFADAPTFKEAYMVLKVPRRQRVSDLTSGKLKAQMRILIAGPKKVDSSDLLSDLNEEYR